MAASKGNVAAGKDYDAVIVGASLAGASTAIALARAGVRVALVEQRPDAGAFKRICSHYIQSSAVASIERLGLLEPMLAAGAVRSRARLRLPWGWVEPVPGSPVPAGINLRRELLDPLVRETAAQTPGVELMLGVTAHELISEDGAVCGLRAQRRDGAELELRCKLLVGADGRGSRVVKLAGVRESRHENGRFAYGGYFEGPAPQGSPDASLWFLDPDMAAAFPTDAGLTFYACMPSKKRLPEFREDPAQALVRFVSRIPDAPPILASQMVGEITGKLDMTNVAHTPTAPGLALVGDAALAADPLWGVGCGWAFQSAEWLADSVAPALRGEESLRRGLARYRRRHARALRGHVRMIDDYSSGRRFNGGERMLFSAATGDRRIAQVMEAFGTRNIGPARMFATALPLALAATVRRSLRGGRARTGLQQPAPANGDGGATPLAR
jgi:2-polyprenyl-6-methoxyphenol hydroxylase-like FAD-dependent oxidoreductase